MKFRVSKRGYFITKIMEMEKNNISNCIVLFFDSIQYTYSADIAYYGLEILALILCFLDEEISNSFLPFTLKWTRLLLIPTVALPAITPFFHRYSRFKPKTIILSPPLYPNPNQFTCILTIIAIQIRHVYPTLSVFFVIAGFTFPIITKYNSFMQIILSSAIGALLSFSYDFSPQNYAKLSLVITYILITVGFLISKPFGEENPVSFQSQLINIFGKTIFDTFLHISYLPYAKRCLIGFLIQFGCTYISKLMSAYNKVINKRTFL